MQKIYMLLTTIQKTMSMMKWVLYKMTKWSILTFQYCSQFCTRQKGRGRLQRFCLIATWFEFCFVRFFFLEKKFVIQFVLAKFLEPIRDFRKEEKKFSEP